MQFPDSRLLRPDPPITAANMIEGMWSRGPMRREFQERFRRFRETVEPEVSENEAFSRFVRQIAEEYFRRFWGICREYFRGNVLHSQFYSYNGTAPAGLEELLEHTEYVDAQSVGTYLNAHGFDSVNTDDADHLALADFQFKRLAGQNGRRPRIAYEFDASCTLNGYPLAALGAMYAANGVQMAAYFTYTPAAVAAWNPGWLVHFLNIAHTPARAAAFASAGKIFRNSWREKIEREEGQWKGKSFVIRRNGDHVVYRDRECFCSSGACDEEAVDRESLTLVCGRGNSPLVQCDGNGFYHLEKQTDGRWLLTLFPAQRYLREPARGRAFLSMANRYVSCVRELPVSQLLERELAVRFPMFRTVRCFAAGTNREIPEGTEGFLLAPGRYLLEETSV